MKMMLKLLCNILLYILIILQLIYECDGQNRRRNQGTKGQRKPRGNNDILPNLSYLWILLSMVFLPPIIYFIYNVIIILLFFFLNVNTNNDIIIRYHVIQLLHK